MPDYVYGCEIKDHPRIDVVHGMGEDPEILCETCGGVMHRIPQSFRFTFGAFNVLHEWSNENFHRYRGRKRGFNMPPFSKDKVQRVHQPQKDFAHR